MGCTSSAQGHALEADFDPEEQIAQILADISSKAGAKHDGTFTMPDSAVREKISDFAALLQKLSQHDPRWLHWLARFGTRKQRRDQWSNVMGNIECTPLRLVKPQGLSDVIRHAAQAGKDNMHMKAVGSGHSYCTATVTSGMLMETHGLSKVADKVRPFEGQLSPDFLKAGTLPLIRKGEQVPWEQSDYKPDEHLALFETQSGVTVQALAEQLEALDLALLNMGGAAWQTIGGYCSTSTHGTGISFGPVSSFVKSWVIVTRGAWKSAGDEHRMVHATGHGTEGVNIYRIEPLDGITDASKYTDKDITLIQSDDAFNAVGTSFGTCGIIYSMILEVCQFYWLKSMAKSTTWTRALEELRAQPPTSGNPNGIPEILLKSRCLEYFWDPYEKYGEHEAVELSWALIPKPSRVKRVAKPLNGNDVVCEIIKEIVHDAIQWLYTKIEEQQITYVITACLFNHFPFVTPWIVKQALKSQVTFGAREGKWYDVLQLHTAQNAGFASEWAFPVQKNMDTGSKVPSPYNCWPSSLATAGGWTTEHLKAATDAISEVVSMQVKQGSQYVTSPMGIRFVKSSDNFLSMMHGTDVAMIELDMAYGTFGYADIMQRLGQHIMLKTGSRFHWGLNFESYESGRLPVLYPELSRFQTQRAMFDESGWSQNSFTRHLPLQNP